jgi:hypothetical protein
MNTVTTQLEDTIQEYQGLFNDPGGISLSVTNLGWTNIENKLQTDAGWTDKGAKHIANLARNYGSFVLRNALALAITLDIEDGKFGL